MYLMASLLPDWLKAESCYYCSCKNSILWFWWAICWELLETWVARHKQDPRDSHLHLVILNISCQKSFYSQHILSGERRSVGVSANCVAAPLIIGGVVESIMTDQLLNKFCLWLLSIVCNFSLIITFQFYCFCLISIQRIGLAHCHNN